MTFQDAEKTYKDIRSQHASGKLGDADFEAQVNQLKVQDAQGRWWQLGVRTGEWYVNDGQKWVKSRPPSASQPPAMPTTSPEDQAAPPQVEKAERPSVLPRGIFSPKPEQHNGGGLPRPVLIGIIAAVAVVVLAVIIGGIVLFSGSLFGAGGATARATTTPTQAIALLPTIAETPTIAPTDTPAPTQTSVITATNTVANPPTPAGTRPSATRRPNTPTPTKAAASTATAVIPPGVYVTKLAADNISPDTSKFQFIFRTTFVNTSGGNWHNPSENGWVIYIFKVDNQDKPYSQTRIVKDIDVPTGTNVISLADPWQVGPAGPPDCSYVAGVYYLDNNMTRVAFLQPDGKQFRLSFSACK